MTIEFKVVGLRNKGAIRLVWFDSNYESGKEWSISSELIQKKYLSSINKNFQESFRHKKTSNNLMFEAKLA